MCSGKNVDKQFVTSHLRKSNSSMSVFEFIIWIMCLGTVFLCSSEKSNFIQKICTKVIKRTSKLCEKNMSHEHEQWVLLSSCWVHRNSKEASYLSWKNKDLNLKPTCHIKPKFWLWTKLQKIIFFVNYLICHCDFKSGCLWASHWSMENG